MGMAHGGHDQCAYCYFHYIKPALQAERAEVKRRRAIKKGLHLSATNRTLINEVDLKEPQIVERSIPPLVPRGQCEGVGVHILAREDGAALPRGVDEQARCPWCQQLVDVNPRGRLNRHVAQPMSIKRAVTNTLIDNAIVRGEADGKDRHEVIADLFQQKLLRDQEEIPAVKPGRHAEPPPVEEVPPTPMPAPVEEAAPTEVRPGRGKRSLLTDQIRKEIADAYAAGMNTAEIGRAYNIGQATLYRIVMDAGLPMRGRHVPKPRHHTEEEPNVPQNTPPASPPTVETVSPNGVVSGLTEWVVTYEVVTVRTETVTIAAKDFNSAAAAVTDGQVVSVARKRP